MISLSNNVLINNLFSDIHSIQFNSVQFSKSHINCNGNMEQTALKGAFCQCIFRIAIKCNSCGKCYNRCVYSVSGLSRWQTPQLHLSDDMCSSRNHDDVIKWKHFPRYWPFVRGIHRSPVNSQHKGQWRGALMFSLICTRIIGWVNNGEAGDLRHHQAHYDIIIMWYWPLLWMIQ